MAVAPQAGACGSSHHGSPVDNMAQLAKALGNQNNPVEEVVLHAAAAWVPKAGRAHRRAAEDTSYAVGHPDQEACVGKRHELAQTPVLEMTLE